MKAGAWSFYLPKSLPRASHWHLQMIKTSMGVVSGHVWSLFCVFLGLPWFFLVLGNASFCLELGFARVSAQVEPLAPRSDQNKVFGIFLSVLGHFSCVPWAWASAQRMGRGDWGVAIGDWGLGTGTGTGESI